MSKDRCDNNEVAGSGSGFALIVVLFILLIIIGASYIGSGSNHPNYGHGGCC